MIERCLFILLSLALVAGVGGFFLYVPILPILAAAVMIAALCGMFWLGIRVGMRLDTTNMSGATAADENQLSAS
jgi:uncharacterized membrane protein